MSDISNDGWSEYGKLVLNELKRLNQGQDDLKKDLDSKFIELNDKISKFNSLESEASDMKLWKNQVIDVWSPSQMKQAKDEIYKQKGYYQKIVGIMLAIQTLVTLLISFKDRIF